MDDPRFKLGGIASELISQLTASLSDHVGWLEDHLEQAAAGAKRRRTTTTTREHASVGGTAAHPASSSWQNLLKSPSKHRQRSRQPHQHSHPAMADAALAAPFAAAAGPVRTPLALVAPGPTAANIFEAAPSPALEKKQQPSTSSSDALAIATAAAATKTKHIVVSATTTSSKPGGSIFRSPGKVGLDKAATAKSPIQDHGGHCRRTSAADEQQLSDKENTSNAAPAPARPSSRQVSTQSSKANARGSKLPFAPPSPAARNALSASLRSPGRAVLGSSASRLQQPRTGSSVSASRPASPTPRPATRSKPASLRSPSAKSSGSNTPIKVVDDVFMLGNACKQGQDRHVAGNENRAAPAEATAATAIDSQDGSDHNNGEEMEEEEEEEDDDGEVADILLGYTSTGSSRTPASASRTIRPNPNAAADTTKQLPSLPAQVQPPAADPDAKVTLTSLHTSPPRPAKSPARPSPTPAKDVKAPTASAAPPSRMQLPGSPVRSVAKAVSRLQQQAQASTAVQPTSAPTQQQHASPRPAPRNMSNLASIASVLGSPVKHASRQQQVQQQNDSPAKTAHAHAIPTSVIQAARKLGLSRPGSPVSASAYAPAAALASSQPTRGATPMAYSSSGGSPTRVPVPRSDAAASPQGEHPPSTAKVAAAQTQAPRVRSPLMSDKISYFQSQSQTDLATTAAAAAALARPISPPTRMSSRLAALSSPATSPKIGGIATAFGGTRQTGQPTALSPRVGARAAATAVSTSSVGGMPKSPRMHGAIAFSGQETVRTGAGRQVGAKHEQHEAETADKSPEDLQAVNVATSSAAQSPPQPQPHKRPALSPVQSPRSIPVPTARANAISPPPAKSPLRKQGRDDTTTPSVEAGTKNAERELKEQMQGASSRAVKALDYAETDAPPPAETDANGSEYQTSNRNAASAAAAVELPRAAAVVTNTCDRVVSLKSSTQTHQSSQLGQSARQPSVVVPPSPIFSSFLSNPNRTSALSFVGLPGRASIQHQGAASNGSMTGQPQPHSREKSIGLGLGLGLGLGKSLSAANAARAGREQHHQQQDSDSQGSASNEHQSFFSAAGSLSGKKRLSSVLADQPESQSSTASGFPGTSKAAKLDAHTSASAIARASISQTSSSSAPPSKEDATKAKLDMLRNRISSFKGTNATNRVSSVSSAMQIYPARLSTAQLVSEKTTIAGASPALPAVVAPSSPPVATTVPPQAIVEVGAGTSAVQIDAAVPAPSAHHTFSSAISAFVPAPSFSASFASLFGASLSKPLQPPSSPVHREQKRDDVASHAHPKHQLQSQSASISMAQTPMYPALPSMTNLAMCLSPPKDQRRVSREPDDDAMEELIQLAPVKPVANTCAVPAAAEAPAVSTHSRRSSTSSVQSIVDAFEAKTTEALEAQERARSTSPVQQKRALAGVKASAALACTEKAAKRSTTPPFSPPIASRMLTTSVISVTSTHTRVSLIPFTDDTAGDLGALDVADPNVEPIASVRESSPLLPTENNEDELGTDDARFGDGAGVEHAVASQTLHAVQTQKPSVPLGASRSGAAPATSLVKPTTGAGASFKPSRPNPESMDSIKMVSRPPSQQAQHRPPSRAPSVSSLAPSRTSTVSAASISKKTGLASSVNGKGELKSLQLAAAAAKREQADKDRKAALREEREQKRAATGTDTDKKRKERDEQSQSQSQSQQSQNGQGGGLATAKGKAPMIKAKAASAAAGKAASEEEAAKKRKIEVEVVVPQKAPVKKTTVVRPAQSGKPAGASVASSLASSTNRQPSTSQQQGHLKSSTLGASTAGGSRQASSSQQSASRPLQSSTTTTSKAPLQPMRAGQQQQQQALLNQHQQAMSALSKSFGPIGKSASSQPGPSQQRVQQQQQVREAHPPAPVEFEPEPFELPEVDSEYSDSDEEEQAKKAAARPGWTHSPNLRQALNVQATFDPDELFGEIPALRMEEMFQQKTTIARLRHRTSSANWSGTDALHKYEEQEYARRMGFDSARQH